MRSVHAGVDSPPRLVSTVLTCLVLLSACVQPTVTPAPSVTPGPRLVIASCPGAQPRLLRWIELYRAVHPEVRLEIRTLSATQAQQALAYGEADLAFLDQAPALVYQGVVTATQVAQEPLAIIVHPENPLRDLTGTTLVELLSGRITDWSQVGGTAGPVQVYLLPGSTGETLSFARQAMGARHLSNQAIVRPSLSSLRQAVAEDPRGIGLLALSDATGEIIVLQVEATPPTAAEYPWHMPLLLAHGRTSPGLACTFIRFVQGLEEPLR